ncbi:DNA-binding transcriptional regulator, PadR family [Devosia crocina]|uniref:DNA-binding transcriptional regulator, PadR family n=1 Tax=Devosia crocina TaxID=429728 RepID=A0A1I7NLX2_9HYPH|nr:PadR family transcriptional regulator [Devosia crocina]SFV35645.1 DNA-binding transcriptional regulator, PadR family [Devosia crocina]
MNVRTLCLSVLYECDATGYDIRRMCVEGECAYFVEASFGSIYPALARLEKEQLVTSRTVPQEGKPARKVYSITDAGRKEFAEELSAPLSPDTFHSPFLLLARFVSILPQDLVAARVQEQLERLAGERKALEQLKSDHPDNPADCWVINYGREVLGVAEKYVRTHMHELITLSRADERKDAAE